MSGCSQWRPGGIRPTSPLFLHLRLQQPHRQLECVNGHGQQTQAPRAGSARSGYAREQRVPRAMVLRAIGPYFTTERTRNYLASSAVDHLGVSPV